MIRRRWIPGFTGKARQLLERVEELLAPLLLSAESACLQPALLRQHVRTGSQMESYRGALEPKVYDLSQRLKIHPAIIAGRPETTI